MVKSYLTSNAAFAQFFTESHLLLMFDDEMSTFVNMAYIETPMLVIVEIISS